MKIKLISNTLNPELTIAMAGKLCYSKVGVEEISERMDENEINRFLNMLASIDHTSPLEHASFTFALEGVSRSFTHQLVRHRIASYSQQSQRYVKLDQFEYIIPPQIANNEVARGIFIRSMKEDQEAYDAIFNTLLEEKAKEMKLNAITEKTVYECYIGYVKKILKEKYKENVIAKDIPMHMLEDYILIDSLDNYWRENNRQQYLSIEKKTIEDARYVFPNACETKIVFTMNLRSIINFISHRKCRRAQWEAREVAKEMEKLITEVSPILGKLIGAPCEFGPCPEGKMTCGVKYERKNNK